MPYIENTRLLGPREPGEIADFSARLDSFLLTPQQNWIWGWTAFKFGGNELHLFTGVVAIVLALLAFARRPRTMAWIYCALALLAASLSLGANGSLYRWLNEYVWVFRGFRAPARFAILSGCALSVLAGFGFLALRGLLGRNPMRRALLIVVLVAVGIECGSAPMILTDVPRRIPDVYKFLQTLNRTVIVEFPMVDYDLTPLFMYGSTFHWHRLVNGYSGYAPPDYRVTRDCMRTFPDDRAIARLRELGTEYVLVHQAYYSEEDFVALMDQVIRRADLVPIGHYKDWLSETYIFQLKASERAP
jgi:hypothetical protein